ADVIIMNLKKLFPNIEIVKIDMAKFKIGAISTKLNRYLNRDSFYKNMLDILLIPSDMLYVRQIYGFQKKMNKNLKISYFEDGLSPYVRSTVLSKSLFDRILNKRSIEKSEWENIFLYEPKMSMLGNYKKTLK